MARPPAPAELDEAAELAPAKKSKKKLFLIIGILVVLLAGGGGAAWFFTQDKDATKEAKAAPPKAPIFMPLETFIVNLQEGEQYLQTDITLQVTDPAQIDALKLHMPRVRSRLLSLLSSKYADELATAEDKEALAQAVLAEVNQPFTPEGKPQQIEDVLFTSFVIQ
ncbi:MAG: flagellar basal body-associated protein FliL [Thiobacillus sp.]